MGIVAVAVLKIDDCELPEGTAMRLVALDDCVLVHTGADFGSQPEELVARLEEVLGDQLSQHDDPRGVFFLPDVAAPKARAYLDVLEEVGEGGQWAPLPDAGEMAFGLPDGLGALSAVLGSVMEHMPEALLQAAGAAAKGDMQAFSQVADHVSAMMGQGGAPLAGLERMLTGGALNPSSPAFQQLLSKLESDIQANPEEFERIRAQFFGDLPAEGDDED